MPETKIQDNRIVKAQRHTEERYVQQQAEELGMSYTNLDGFPMDREAIAMLTEREIQLAKAVMFYKESRYGKLGVVDPKGPYIPAIVDFFKQKGFTLDIFLISEGSLRDALNEYKFVRKKMVVETGTVAITAEQLARYGKDITETAVLQKKITEAPTSDVLAVILAGSVALRSSDVHIDPEKDHGRVRFRIDGVLQDVATLDMENSRRLVTRIKLISQLKLNITSVPQDGRFSIRMDKKNIDVRVSTLPSSYGETVVMRLLGTSATNLKVNELGMRDVAWAVLEKQLKKTTGMILTTGPTGSGKTTTLYAFLNYVYSPEINIITLENPIEYRLPGISQTQIDHKGGYDFAAGLRAVLRQDPDIIMVGEIRDLETADIAINAALTGHVVFSTLHTNDSAGVIPRLMDMGVRPFILAPAINAVIAQRLVRKICDACKEEYTATPEEITRVKEKFATPGSTHELPEFTKLYKGKGCSECNTTGYQGRVGIYEVFPIDAELEKLILSAGTVAEIREATIKAGMLTMAQDGVLKAIEGTTTIDEVERVA